MADQGIPFENDQGEPGRLSGKPQGSVGPRLVETSWVDKRHPYYEILADDEHRSRASFIATRRALAPYLVPHRFEGNTKGEDLRRAGLGFGLRLNQPFVGELFGHIRGAGARYWWGQLSTLDEPTSDAPPDGIAATLWGDATGRNVSWKTFFERKVLEWIGTSPGGLIVVDATRNESGGVRPTLMLTPWSWVEDYGVGKHGLTYVRLAEFVDNRDPRDKDDKKLTRRHLLYELDEQGNTLVSRYDSKGNSVPIDGEEILDMGRFIDNEGDPRLPMVAAVYGEHPEAPEAGTGLLAGLDDIVIDAYNQMSEIREGYRDVSFGMLTYRGTDFDEVEKAMSQGTRLVNLGGSDEGAALERVAAESAEVQAGLSLLETSLNAWKLSARRKVTDAMERATAQSGVSMKAEFQLDSRPLLVEITELLDEIETDVMRLVLQVVEGEQSPEKLATVMVERQTTYNLEDEADRISRIIEDAVRTFDVLPAEVMVRAGMRWLEETRLFDLDEEIEVEGDENVTLREVAEGQFRDLADSRSRERIQRAQNFGFSGIPGAFGAPPEPEDQLVDEGA